ncbi:ribonuclease HII [bacterium]|nr:ribonuclease HII [bacterium]
MSGKNTFEQQCYTLGYQYVAGVDEVGMGCLAGPVVAAAVILPRTGIPRGIDDSKKLTPKKREELDLKIREKALCFAIAMASVEEIDTINIFHAAKLAMIRAVQALATAPDYLLIDGKHGLNHPIAQKTIVQGDHLSVSIGAASILAKVHRDRMMAEMDTAYPGYSFASHKGYGSVDHRKALQNLGRSPIHRKSFSWTPV